jgi:hypothetical protein
MSAPIMELLKDFSTYGEDEYGYDMTVERTALVVSIRTLLLGGTDA